MSSPRRILVTAALPYANGPIHLGHLVEYIQTDIWVRFQRLRGNQCVYICADDTHGTAIMISARKKGVTEEQFIAQIQKEHERDFAGFDVVFDNYGSTNSTENRVQCARFWKALRDADLVVEREVTQLYDPQEGVFLADRFVRGTCPNTSCNAEDQFGDSCAVCGHTHTAAELINPISVYSGSTPEVRSAPHLFITLERLHGFLDEWTQSADRLPAETANHLKKDFLAEPLRDWDISRRGPYFGFEIPDSPGNYWFVWFDAPIGYVASTQQWCERTGEEFDKWWLSDGTEVHHFIGKDIAYFHTLFWPAMLKTAGFTLPTKVHIHGFLTVDGKKMSKRDGTFVKAATYLKHLDPSYLRYYYASKLGPHVHDLDLNLGEFQEKIKSDLVGKVVNLASRSAKFVHKLGLSAAYPDDGGLFEFGAQQGQAIAEAYERCDYNRAMRLIIELADRANPFVENAKPWELRKDEERQTELQDICTIALNLFRQIVIYLQPVLPDLASKTEELLGEQISDWRQAGTPLLGTPVAKFKHMLQRIDPQDIDKMIEESKQEFVDESADTASPYNDSDQSLKDEPLAEQCTIDDFVKVNLRVARVINAEHVEEARKLLKLTLSLGGSETRTVFAGIKQAYEPEKLVGRLVVLVANLAPRKMKFGVSEGMVIASGPGAEDVFLLSPDDGAVPGQRVH